MKFDSNLAWKEASAKVRSNREVLIALVGAFFVLPSFALALLVPQVEPQPGATPRDIYLQMTTLYADNIVWLMLMTAIQLIGTLAMLTLFTDRTRPTVATAIRLGAIGAIPCLAAQLLVGMASGVAIVIPAAIGAVTGSGAITALLLIVTLGVVVWGWIRSSLVAPVIAVERVYNPVKALIRSWGLTKGNAGRLLLFYFLLGLAFAIVGIVVLGLIGLVLAVLLPAEPAKVGGALMQSLFTGLFVLYFIAVLAAVHRQLAGPSTDTVASTFE